MILSILKSRTVWTLAVMFVVGGLESVRAYIPSEVFSAVFGVLTLLAAYFRLVPKQNYHE